ncbi:hydantoinase B/oxoprolinase family protein [Rhizorhabdus wittichii]|uniref:hydantoinase B/oxoprolinase family protein n=1 Tax=Rhizorhabdus wittichii TaxID=160791 RepID=UPI000311A9B1|nr:hydantoinase B/oxoprolinase family protein [Rhizorhabdus wittichii]
MDPITFSIIRHRLYRVVEEAVITLKHVSGSAITNEGHDLMVSLYRADGSLLMGGVGFLHHLTSASEACKAIIRRFAGQINEGDLFLLNDPYTAALHTSDVYLVSPIHHDGKLVAWSACFVHVFDIGAMNPGGFAPDAPDIFSEGFSSPGLKLIDRGVMREDVWDTMLNMVRGPEMVALDLRSMIACNNVAKERMLALIDKYGADTVDEAGSTLIEQSERRMRDRLRELPDGEWQSRQYFSVKDEVYRVLLTMRKSGDELEFDFTGSSPQSPYSLNCSKWAALGGLFAPLFPLLCYDITWNEGVIRPVRMIAPEGTVVNCRRPAPVSVATVGAIQSVNNAACAAIGKMLSASDRYADEATAVWHANHFAIFMFGANQRGGYSIGILTETFAGAGGGRQVGDGVDIGGEIPNPISRMANVETIEATFPVRYLFRRRRIDSGGPGRHRGGVGGEFMLVAHDAPDGGIDYVISGKGAAFPQSDGMAGGYSGAANDYVRIAGVGGKDVPLGAEDVEGKREAIAWGVHALRGNDALHVRWNGGGGFGDPLDRSAESIGRDVADGTVSVEAARTLYGVVLADGALDPAATERARAAMRLTRKNREAA